MSETVKVGGSEYPIVSVTIGGQDTSLLTEISLLVKSNYANLQPFSAVSYNLPSNIQTPIKSATPVYVGFTATKSGTEYVQTLQFVDAISLLLKTPFAFPIQSMDKTAYDSIAELMLYRFGGGKDITKIDSAKSLFEALLKNDTLKLSNLFDLASSVSSTFQEQYNKFKNLIANDLNLTNFKPGIEAIIQLLQDGQLNTPLFIDLYWIIDTITAYSCQSVYIDLNGAPVLVSEAVDAEPKMVIDKDIERVNIWYSWVIPRNTLAFVRATDLGSGFEPILTVEYDGFTGQAKSIFSPSAISPNATIFGGYSPETLTVSVPLLVTLDTDKNKMTNDLNSVYKIAANFAKKHYWKLYKQTNSYEITYKYGQGPTSGIGSFASFKLNNGTFTGQITGIFHHWEAGGGSYTKVRFQGVRGNSAVYTDTKLICFKSIS